MFDSLRLQVGDIIRSTARVIEGNSFLKREQIKNIRFRKKIQAGESIPDYLHGIVKYSMDNGCRPVTFKSFSNVGDFYYDPADHSIGVYGLATLMR